MDQPSPCGPAARFDPERRFVRVRALRADGFVEFDFAVGEPEVFVEMMLHADAFDDFCAANRVSFLTGDAPDADCGDDGERRWRLSGASGGRFR